MTSALHVLSSQTLRATPQLAPLHMLVQAIQLANIALCAAHPEIERPRISEPLPADILAERVLAAAWRLLDAVDDYRDLLHDLASLDAACSAALLEGDHGIEF